MVNKKQIIFESPRCLTTGTFCFKQYLTIAFAFVSLLSFSQAKINFTESKKTFGTVKQGEVVVLEYEFTNTGTEPLIFNEAKVECSCTTVDYPKQPIAPGQKNKVTVKFNTTTVWELQDRVVKLYSNAKNSPAKIRFKGDVKMTK